ncbi:hypothetical protein GCM10027321_22420 [Massilia terrae]
MRKFKYVGKIDENTKVLGSPYGRVKELLRIGFETHFTVPEIARFNDGSQKSSSSPLSEISSISSSNAHPGSIKDAGSDCE